MKTVLTESGRNEGCNGIIEDFRYNKTSYGSDPKKLGGKAIRFPRP